MDGLDERLQPAHAWPLRIRYVQAEKIDHALVAENRCTVRSESPDQARNHVHELRELPLPVPQRRFGDRKSVVEGTSVSVRVDLGGRRSIKKNTQNKHAPTR